MKPSKQMKMKEFSKITKRLLGFCSLWIEPENDFRKFTEALRRWTVSYLLSVMQLISVMMDMILRSDSIEQWADASYYFFMQLSFCLKLMWFRLKYDKFKLLVLGAHELQEGSERTIRPFLARSNFVTVFFLTNCYVNWFFMSCFPFIEARGTMGFRLPLSGWFPWDVTRSGEGKFAAYFFQVIGMFFGITINASLDMLVVQLLLASCWQVRLLKNNLRRITSEMIPEEINDRMVSCAKHYLAILRYVELVEDVFGNGLFFQFFASGCGMCITGIEVIVIPMGSGRFFTTIGYLMALVIQISAYCWAGQQLITESDGITTCCYKMDWWYGSAGLKKAKVALKLMMVRCKKPISLRAGRFFTLSVFTLATIFRTSYSYFAVLQRMHTKNEEH